MTGRETAGAVGAAAGLRSRTPRGPGNPRQPHSTARPIFVQGRPVGRVCGDTFYKTVRGSVHMLRKPLAWAMDAQALLDAERSGARLVEIHDSETGNTYRASVETIRAHGFVFDRGHGRQVALVLDRWAVAHPGEPVAAQLCLFEAQGVGA